MMEFDLIRLIAGGMYLPTKVTPVLACFDESGKFRDTEMTTFGGVMIRRTDFCHSWRQQLQEYSLPYTSMKDAMSFSGPFKPWGDMADGKLKRDELIRRFGKLLLESGVIRTHSTIPSVEFNTLSRADKKSLGGDPQYACFQACIMGLLTQFPDAQIHILCDLSTQYSEKCLKLYHKLRERENRWLKIALAEFASAMTRFIQGCRPLTWLPIALAQKKRKAFPFTRWYKR